MWPLGHAAIGYLCYRFATRVRFGGPPSYGPVLALAVGTQFPDLVDKPPAWFLDAVHSSSGPGHSVVVLGALTVGLACCLRPYERSEYAVAFGVGAVAHALVDAVEVLWNPYVSAGPLFWPLATVSRSPVVDSLFEPLAELYLVSEFVLAGLALGCWYRDGYPGLAPLRVALERALRAA